VVNKVLSLLEDAGTKVVAYVDDVVILLQGKFPQTLGNLMEAALSDLSRWTADCGLGVNSEKTELVLFKRMCKIPNRTLPKLHQTRNKTKYIGVTPDKKLHWTDNILDRTRKAAIAPFAAIVRPILLYRNIVWWPSLENICNLRILHKI